MFDILLYLFENYVHNQTEVWLDEKEVNAELLKAGFDQADIYKAMDWLEQLVLLQRSDETPYLYTQPIGSLRCYTEDEQRLFDTGCIGFMMFLEQVGVLDWQTREMVIDRLVALERPQISLEDLKWVVLMVLFNVPGKELAYSQMEELLFLEQPDRLH